VSGRGAAGDDRGLVTHGGGDDDDVYDVCGAGGRACDAGGAAGGLVVRKNVAALEDTRDLVLGAAAPGLGQDDDRDDRADVCGGDLVVQGQEVGIAPFGGQERAGVIDDGGALPGGPLRLVAEQASLGQERAGALAGGRRQRPVLALVLSHHLAGASAARGVQGSGAGLLGGGLGQPRRHRHALAGGCGLDRLLDLGRH
jgi:hypothetical protein